MLVQALRIISVVDIHWQILQQFWEIVKDVESTSLDNVKVYVDNGANRNGVTATAGKTHQYTKVSNDVESTVSFSACVVLLIVIVSVD